MGNDGGVVAVKRKFMRHANQKSKGEKVDQELQRIERATTCAISGEPLQEPIVACELGNLFNKQALLEHLLAKTIPERYQHITSLKDVVTCRFSKQMDDKTSSAAVFYCPITMVEFNGKQPFVVVWSCGCVLSERATKEVQTTDCLGCGQAMNSTVLVSLLQGEEVYAEKQQQILARKADEKQKKKDEKKKGDKKRHDRSDADEISTKRKEKKVKVGSESATSAVSSIAHEATSAIEEAKAKNKVFASLFAKDKSESKRSANDLLMAVGGMRYNLS